MITPQPDQPPMPIAANPIARSNVRSIARAAKVSRGANLPAAMDAEAELSRRRSGVMLLSAIAMSAYYGVRLRYDTVLIVVGELLLGVLFVFAICRCFRPADDAKTSRLKQTDKRDAKTTTLGFALVALCVVFPWLLDWVFRASGRGNGSEILMLGSLGWGAVVLAWAANQLRTLSLSVVTSGFLVLFATFISDNSNAVYFVYVWIAFCLWWLLNNHWSTVQCLAASQVKTSPQAKWSYLFLALALVMAATGAAWDRIPVLRKLSTELMPTSGGTSGKDMAARSGVGDGDALVAARKHAASFGAVETDFFLDSEKTSLFDVFSDEFGEPKTKNRVERAQALNPDDVESNEGQFAETNRSAGGNEFSIERDPPRKKDPPEDLYSDSLMFWEGAAGVRLAAQRYSHFDGTRWLRSVDGDEAPEPVELRSIVIEERTWFRPSKSIQNSISPFVGALPEAVKFTRFRSFEIPSRMGTQLWSIDQITLPDFFAYGQDDCLIMPNRTHIPDYTVVRFVNSRVDQERLEGLLRNCAPGTFHRPTQESCQSELAKLAHQYSGSAERGLQQVENVINGVRRDFDFQRAATDGEGASLERFLEDKRGPSYLFATAAALMLDHLGYQTRLVMGFYVAPEHYSAREKSTAILSEDAHVWVEINAGHDYWIPLEPTPGFRKPRWRAGWLYLAQKNWKALTLGTLVSIICIWSCYLLRSFLFASLCRVLSPLLRWLPDRSRLAWLCWMLDIRWLLIGHPRPASTTHRKRFCDGVWGLEPAGQALVLEFLDVADCVRYGDAVKLTSSQRSLTHSILAQIHRIKSPKSRLRAKQNENEHENHVGLRPRNQETDNHD